MNIRVFLEEDGEMVDLGECDTNQDAVDFIRREGTVDKTYYIVDMDRAVQFHIKRELVDGPTVEQPVLPR